MLNLALGRRPKALEYKGKYRVAGNFMLRIYDSGRVFKIPSQQEIDKLREKYPELILRFHVHEGMHLSDLQGQDSYSYELANLFLGARDQEELNYKYEDCMANLTFDVAPDEVPQVR